MTLREQIVAEIRRRGPIPFSGYMELCLYSPEGFYSRQKEQFGKAGDFYTSSDVHAVFGRLLARQFDEMWRALDRPQRLDIVEFGPGRGLFAQDVLDWSEKKFPDCASALHYTLVEGSPTFRARLEQRFAERIAAGAVTVCRSLDELPGRAVPEAGQHRGDAVTTNVPEAPYRPTESADAGVPEAQNRPGGTAPAQHDRVAEPRGSAGSGAEAEMSAGGTTPSRRDGSGLDHAILFANEFFDAFPVEIVSSDGELHIDEQNGDFREIFLPPAPEVLEYLDRYSVHPEKGERVEAPLAALDYARHIAPLAARGFCLFIDYGYTRQEQLAGSHRDTLKAFRQHTMSANPYEAPGDQDLTTDVNFTALAAAMNEWDQLALLTQAQFLMGVGEPTQFADAFEDTRLPQERAKVLLQLKHLVTPAGMGEAFHVLVMGKGIDTTAARRLSGLTFAR